MSSDFLKKQKNNYAQKSDNAQRKNGENFAKYLESVIIKKYDDSCLGGYYWTLEDKKLDNNNIQLLINNSDDKVSLKWRLVAKFENIKEIGLQTGEINQADTNKEIKNKLKIVNIEDSLPIECIQFCKLNTKKITIVDINPEI